MSNIKVLNFTVFTEQPFTVEFHGRTGASADNLAVYTLSRYFRSGGSEN
jgi:hypothetical protein